MVEKMVKEFGRLDIAVASAGIILFEILSYVKSKNNSPEFGGIKILKALFFTGSLLLLYFELNQTIDLFSCFNNIRSNIILYISIWHPRLNYFFTIIFRSKFYIFKTSYLHNFSNIFNILSTCNTTCHQ